MMERALSVCPEKKCEKAIKGWRCGNCHACVSSCSWDGCTVVESMTDQEIEDCLVDTDHAEWNKEGALEKLEDSRLNNQSE